MHVGASMSEPFSYFLPQQRVLQYCVRVVARKERGRMHASHGRCELDQTRE